MSTLGITAGAHRLWAHRSYHARMPLRILLALFNSMAFQASLCVHIALAFIDDWFCFHLGTLAPYGNAP